MLSTLSQAAIIAEFPTGVTLTSYTKLTISVSPISSTDLLKSSEWDLRQAFKKVVTESPIYENINMTKKDATITFLYQNENIRNVYQDRIIGRTIPVGPNRLKVEILDTNNLLSVSDKSYKSWKENSSLWLRNLPSRWFQLDSNEIEDNMQSHPIKQMFFSIFGPIEHIEIVDSTTDNTDLLMTGIVLNKDICIKFENFNDCETAMQKLGQGNILIQKKGIQATHLLEAYPDTEGYLLSEKIAKRNRHKEKINKIYQKLIKHKEKGIKLIENIQKLLNDKIQNIPEEISSKEVFIASRTRLTKCIDFLSESIESSSLIIQNKIEYSKIPSKYHFIISLIEKSIEDLKFYNDQLQQGQKAFEENFFKIEKEYLTILKSRNEEQRIIDLEQLRINSKKESLRIKNLCLQCREESKKIGFEESLCNRILSRTETLCANTIDILNRHEESSAPRFGSALKQISDALYQQFHITSPLITALKFYGLHKLAINRAEDDLNELISERSRRKLSTNIQNTEVEEKEEQLQKQQKQPSVVTVLIENVETILRDAGVRIDSFVSTILESEVDSQLLLAVPQDADMDDYSRECSTALLLLRVADPFSQAESIARRLRQLIGSGPEPGQDNLITTITDIGTTTTATVSSLDEFEYRANRLQGMLRSELRSPAGTLIISEKTLQETCTLSRMTLTSITTALENYENDLMNKENAMASAIRDESMRLIREKKFREEAVECEERALMAKEEKRVMLLLKIEILLRKKEKAMRRKVEEEEKSRRRHLREMKKDIEGDRKVYNDNGDDSYDTSRWIMSTDNDSTYDNRIHYDSQVVSVIRPPWAQTETGSGIGSQGDRFTRKSDAHAPSPLQSTVVSGYSTGKEKGNGIVRNYTTKKRSNVIVVEDAEADEKEDVALEELVINSSSERSELELREILLAKAMKKRRVH
eukprot:gene5733-11591_t